MGAATFSPTLCCCCVARRKTLLLLSSPASASSVGLRSRLYSSISHLGFGPLPQWRGLKHIGISSHRDYGHKEKKEKCRGKVVYASLFGVGAPEALVIGVVALLVFGPKGLAEVARNLGKTLRAFQPTIRELQEVSREFKSTLEREIGLDEVGSSTSYSNKSTSYVNESQQAMVDPNGKPSSGAYTSEELLKVTEDQLAASAARPHTEAPTTEEKPQAASTSEAVTVPSEITAAPAPAPESAAQAPTSEKGDNERR